MSETLVTIPNYHAIEAPAIDSDNLSYLGYFENRHREQWIYMVDKSGVEHIFGGDLEWAEMEYGNTILGDDERVWLASCRLAADMVRR